MTPGSADPEGDLSRVATLPNAITLSRLIVLGAFLVVLFGPGDRVLATILLAVAGSTDFLDGYLARRLGQVSTLGKVIDPVADRVVLGGAVIAIIVYGAVPLWLGVLVLAREALVSIGTMVLAALGARRIDVVWFGKAGTFAMMTALPLFLLGHGPGSWTSAVRVAAWCCALPGEAFLLLAAAHYVPAGRRALAEGRTARAARGAAVGGAGGAPATVGGAAGGTTDRGGSKR